MFCVSASQMTENCSGKGAGVGDGVGVGGIGVGVATGEGVTIAVLSTTGVTVSLGWVCMLWLQPKTGSKKSAIVKRAMRRARNGFPKVVLF